MLAGHARTNVCMHVRARTACNSVQGACTWAAKCTRVRATDACARLACVCVCIRGTARRCGGECVGCKLRPCSCACWEGWEPSRAIRGGFPQCCSAGGSPDFPDPPGRGAPKQPSTHGTGAGWAPATGGPQHGATKRVLPRAAAFRGLSHRAPFTRPLPSSGWHAGP